MIIMVQPTSNAFLFLSKATIFNFTAEPQWDNIISGVALILFLCFLEYETLYFENRHKVQPT